MAKKEKKAKKRKVDTLDTETTIADMNVEGFRWYDPTKKDGQKKQKADLTKKEQRALIRGAYKAMIPMILCIGIAFIAMYFLAMLWLR